MARFNIAIDGPGGAGKSSVSKLIAKKLGIIYVDTGALYRAIALHMSTKGIETTDREGVVRELKNVKLKLIFKDRQILLLNGEDVGDKIRTPEMSMGASNVSAISEVRAFLLDLQRRIAKKNSVIMDGRDIGTVILPDAELKIFLVASPEARAKRRYEELCAKGIETTYEAVLEEMNLRDKNDSTRKIAPCVQATDAILLDNSNLTLEETADKIIKALPLAIERKQSRRIYMRAHRLIAPLVRFFMGVSIEGKENIPKEGGVIVCANHIAIRDPILIAACFPRQVRYVAKKELFSVPVISSVIRTLGAIRMDRKGNDVAALRSCTQLAKLGEAVAIFPQGHRYPGVNPETTPLKAGAAQIAFRSGQDVLPVCIKVKNNKYGFLRRVKIIVGKVIPHDSLPFGNGGSEAYSEVTEIIFKQIVKLGDFSSLPSLQAPKNGDNA